MKRYVQFYCNVIVHYYKYILVFLSLFVGILSYFSWHLNIDASAETLLLENDKDLRLTREVHSRYPDSDYLVIAYSPKNDLLSDATLDEVKKIKASLLEVEGVKNVVSILDVPLLQSPPRSIKEFINDVRTLQSPNIDKELVKKELTTSPLYKNNLVSSDGKTMAIVINLKEDKKYDDFIKTRNALLDKKNEGALTQEDRAQLIKIKHDFQEYRDIYRARTHQMIQDIRHIIAEHHDSGELFLGGVLMVADDMISFVKDDIETYGTSVLVIMTLVLWTIFRQMRYVAIPLAVAFCSVVITAGIYALLGFEITVISSNFISMQLIMSISLAIHVVSNYRENTIKNEHLTQEELITTTMHKMILPMAFVVSSSVAAYMSLIWSGILPVIHFGWMMVVASCISFLFAIVFIPSMLMFLGKKRPVLTFDKFDKLTLMLASIVKTHPKTIYFVSFCIIVFSIVGTTQLMVENSFINYFKDKTEIYQGMKKIDEKLGGTTSLEVVVKFAQTPGIQEKSKTKELDSFEDEYNQDAHESQYWFTDQKMDQIMRIQEFLERQKGVGNVSSLATLLRVGEMIKGGSRFDNLELGILYKTLSDNYKNVLMTPYVNVDQNEARFILRIEDSSKGLRREALIQQIQTGLKNELGLKEGEFEVVGMVVLYNNMLQSLYQTQILTVGETISIVGLMFLFLFRSIKVGLIAVVVNIIPIGIIFGIMGIFGIPLDIMNITIAAIAFDMALNNTVYYYLRFQDELKKDGDYTATMYRAHGSVGNPMYYCASVSVIGFMILTTSNFVPTVIFGLLTVVTIFVAIVADLLLSPLLLITFKPFSKL